MVVVVISSSIIGQLGQLQSNITVFTAVVSRISLDSRVMAGRIWIVDKESKNDICHNEKPTANAKQNQSVVHQLI